MSKLAGIINEKADPSDHFNHWLWRATEIPWEAEQLTIEKMDVEGGNVQFRVIGPATPRYPDGVFLKMQVNKELSPAPAFVDRGPVPPAPVVDIPQESGGSAPPLNVTVEKLPGESQAQTVRRKAIALRWQANKLEKLAEDMEALEAQGLI